MKSLHKISGLVLLLLFVAVGNSHALVWGVNPSNEAGQLVNLDPFTGAVSASFDLPYISSGDTEIGLAGWSNALYYANSNYSPDTIYTIDPTNGQVISDFSISGGWEVDGLGYWSGADGSFIYTSGCSADDVHRYNAADGSAPEFYWSDLDDPRSIAGDNGGRIFAYGQGPTGAYGIYELSPTDYSFLSYVAAGPSTSIVGMAYDGTYLYMSDIAGFLYTLDSVGNLINSLDLGYTLYALGSTEGSENPPVDPVPEPATLVLLGSGLLGMAGLRKKFRK